MRGHNNSEAQPVGPAGLSPSSDRDNLKYQRSEDDFGVWDGPGTRRAMAQIEAVNPEVSGGDVAQEEHL